MSNDPYYLLIPIVENKVYRQVSLNISEYFEKKFGDLRKKY